MGDLTDLHAAREAANNALADEAKPPPAPGATPPAPAAPAGPAVAADDAVLEVKYRGAPIRLPVAEARALVAKGYDYSRSMQELKQREAEIAELERDKALIDDYRKFRDWLAANPAAAEEIQAVTRRAYEKQAGGPAAPAAESAPPAAKKPAPAALPPEVDELIRERRERTLADAVRSAVQSQPMFAANPKLAARAEQKLRAVASAVPDASLEAVAAAYAEEVKALTAETLPDARTLERERYGSTVPPGGPAPAPASQAPIFNGADFDTGRCRAAAFDALGSM